MKLTSIALDADSSTSPLKKEVDSKITAYGLHFMLGEKSGIRMNVLDEFVRKRFLYRTLCWYLVWLHDESG